MHLPLVANHGLGNSVANEIADLATAIGRCENFVQVAINGGSNSCKKIIDWQIGKHGLDSQQSQDISERVHCPEPWAGNLATARVMFLSSNPSLDVKERFPTLSWNSDDTVDFFVKRFSQDRDRKFGATDGPNVNDMDRVILNDESLTRRVRTWAVLRSRAAVLLNQPLSETLASRDYVMTEVVHCKSHKEFGVNEALSVCVNKWFLPMIKGSAARLVVVSGTPAGLAVKRAVDEITGGKVSLRSNWGSWKNKPSASGTWPISTKQLEEWASTGRWQLSDQATHVQEIELDLDNGSQPPRRIIFMWMPHPTRAVPQQLDDPKLYAPELLARLRSTLNA